MEGKHGLLTPVRAIRKSAIVAEKIKTMILNNGLKTGDRLPTETELGNLLRVSRSTIREGFHALELVGMIEVRPGSGAFVKDTNIFNLFESSNANLSMLLASKAFTTIDILEVRKILEIAIAESVSCNSTDEELNGLEEILLEMAEGLHLDLEFKVADMKFHRELAQLTKNRFLKVLANAMYQIFWERFSNDNDIYSGNPELCKTILNLHFEMVQAFREKNSDKAKELMIRHMNIATDISESYIRELNNVKGNLEYES